MPDPANKGGRPKNPEGEGTVAVSVRINEALLEQLRQSAAERWGGNISREINNRLRASLRRERDEGRDPTIRAFGFLIAELVEKIHHWPVREGAWHRNPFLFRVFRLSVAKLLTELEPPGKIRPPRNATTKFFKEHFGSIAKEWTSPVRAASYVAERTLIDFFGRPKARMPAAEAFPDKETARLVEQLTKALDRTWYGMGQAREDLKIGEATQKGERL